MRLGLALSCTLVAGSCGGSEAERPRPLVAREGACSVTLECAKGLHCSAGACAEPANDSERAAIEVAQLERKIAETQRLEEAAYTAQGKQRMRDERVELEAKLTALRGG